MMRSPSARWSISRCRTIIVWWMAPWRTSSWAKSSTRSRTGRKKFSKAIFHSFGFTTKACGLVAVSSKLPATSYLLSSMCATPKLHNWGSPPWQIDFTATSKPAPLPNVLDFAVIGGGLAGFSEILDELGVECDRHLHGAWEVARDKALADSPISWNDSGTLRVTKEVPGA